MKVPVHMVAVQSTMVLMVVLLDYLEHTMQSVMATDATTSSSSHILVVS
jgi:hypothetical protein